MERQDLTKELWREYEWPVHLQFYRTYRIKNPVALWVGKTTHRILDETGVVHCVPTVGEKGCALRWENKDPDNPVSF